MKVGWGGGLPAQGSCRQTTLLCFSRPARVCSLAGILSRPEGPLCRAPGARSEQLLQGPRTTHQGPSRQQRLRPSPAGARARRLRPGQSGWGPVPIGIAGRAGGGADGSRRGAGKARPGSAVSPESGRRRGQGRARRCGARLAATWRRPKLRGTGWGAGGRPGRRWRCLPPARSQRRPERRRLDRARGPPSSRPEPWADGEVGARGGLLSGPGLRPAPAPPPPAWGAARCLLAAGKSDPKLEPGKPLSLPRPPASSSVLDRMNYNITLKRQITLPLGP
ncbi:collagen alpha-1(I) chain [Artibeus jamaicensis]|uniref:collagen alpha-1(I) chain n=1 Tax=Artibeus jamaicensis TaxID=9417 RepID=UPI00235A5B20|nr:collagen alpha-1(I) chain [Artibeus jamaicensis]